MRRLCVFSFSFAVAAAVCQYLLPPGPRPLAAAVLFGVGLILWAVLRGDRRRAAFLAALGLAAGLLWSWGYDRVIFSRALELDGRREQVEAEAADFPVTTYYGSYVDLKLPAGKGPALRARAYIYDSSGDILRPGDRLLITADFSTTDRVGEREVTSYTSKGCFLFMSDVEDIRVTASPGVTVSNFHVYLRRAIQDRIREIFPSGVRAFMLAILTGDRTELSVDAAAEVYLQRSGVSHIVAVSGMHVSILAGFLLTVLGRRRWAVLAALPVLALFAAVSGFSASVVRAVVMQGFILLAPLVMREADSLTALAAALLLLLLINPYAIAGVSLQLSFAATLGIILFAPKIYVAISGEKPGERKKGPKRSPLALLKRWVLGSISTTAAALALTMPISAIYFGSVSLIAPVSNLLILWAVTPAFILGALAVGAAFIWLPLGRALAFCPSLAVRFILFAVKLLSKPSLACVYLDGALRWWFAASYAATAGVFLLRMRAGRAVITVSAAVVCLCAILIIEDQAAAALPGYTLTALDVGQGESLVLTCGGHTVIIDCGTSGWQDAGELAERYVRSRGRDRVDALILTHYHADHAGGAEHLLAALDVDMLLAPEPEFEESALDEAVTAAAEDAGCEIRHITGLTTVELGETTLTLYPPMGSDTENERGLAVLISEGGFETLVLGDMPGYIERQLIARYELPDIECLVVGHHGSKTSTTAQLLDALTPELAVISVGENSYGHPAGEVLDRLAARDIQIMRTDENGNIILSSR